MAERKFKDCDGDTWTEVRPGELRITEYANGTSRLPEWTSSISDVQHESGPLTEIRPDVDVRALLADVMDGLAEDALLAYWGATAGPDERVYGKLADIFGAKARELREVSA
jgi:hypothetical protein